MNSSNTSFLYNETVYVTGEFMSRNKPILGKIKGIAAVSQPSIGATYIIECTDGTLPNDFYKFNTFVAPESFVRSLDSTSAF